MASRRSTASAGRRLAERRRVSASCGSPRPTAGGRGRWYSTACTRGGGRAAGSERRHYSHCQYSHCGYIGSMTIDRAEIDALLPLPPATFHILMALADQERHGYAIIQDVAERTDGELRMSAGTLYRSIQRMLEQGLIAETTKRPAAPSDDSRRRYYRITSFGTAVARAEMRRLTQ